LVLIVGGPAAGKDTLSQAILSNVLGVVVADGYELVVLPKSPLTEGFSPNKLYIKNGFLTRDYPQQNNPRLLTCSCQGTSLYLDSCKFESCTR
jgi:hypothetical protein